MNKEEFIQQLLIIDKSANTLREMVKEFPDTCGGKKSEMGTMVQAILDYSYTARLELDKIKL